MWDVGFIGLGFVRSIGIRVEGVGFGVCRVQGLALKASFGGFWYLVLGGASGVEGVRVGVVSGGGSRIESTLPSVCG